MSTLLNLSFLDLYRWQVIARFVLAIFGGYFLSAATSSVLTLILPFSAVDAVLVATTLSIAFYSLFFIMTFAVKSLSKIATCYVILGLFLSHFIVQYSEWL
ncbi:hypothetical protein PALB_14040 [Pseudoalteromonas luteoviolacea B = ATCC 29581]|nr:hypothetical protein PALB_14040 [Pseudoalteromonas luteoviolacea B = ATCC 29581]